MNKIIACDFDGTLCKNNWPGIGAPEECVIQYLKDQVSEGNKIILYTCRSGSLLTQALRWCYEKGLIFDAVNENLPEVIEKFGGDTRKIYADEYIDDHNSTRFIFDN